MLSTLHVTCYILHVGWICAITYYAHQVLPTIFLRYIALFSLTETLFLGTPEVLRTYSFLQLIQKLVFIICIIIVCQISKHLVLSKYFLTCMFSKEKL